MPTTINDELLRIEGAKADIATAIGGKGVTVPANAKIDDFADLIDTIQTGGDGLTWNEVVKQTTTSITLTEDEDLTAIKAYQFYNYRNLESINFPNGITTIENYAFNNCFALKSIILPNTVTTVGNYGFANCRALTSVSLSNSMTSIAISAFMSCLALTEIDLPASIVTINANAFNNCLSLAILIVRSNSCAMSNISALQSTPIASGTGKIYVPYGYGNTYKGMSNWSAYASQIYELDENGNIPT